MLALRKWDWDAQRFVEVLTPPGPIVKFMLWLRETKAWHEDVELVHRRFRAMEKEVAEQVEEVRLARVATAVLMTAPADVPKRTHAEAARENLKKARAKRHQPKGAAQ